jgi:flavodoxin
MRALVIYDSFFGNTEKIARAIAHALNDDINPTGIRVRDAKIDQLKGIDLLLVGSPTRGFKPTKDISTFLKSIPREGLRNVRVAAFDTRSDMDDVKSGLLKMLVGWFGYAAKPIADKLVKKGGELIAPPEGFFVKGREGPLRDGELERAAIWARDLIKQ